MISHRVTSFAIQADGSRSFAVHVGHARVLVTVPEGHHEAGLTLAHQIAALGPEAVQEPASCPAPEPVQKAKRAQHTFIVGQRVRCTVRGAEGEHTVIEVGAGRRRGYIRISGERAWCPSYNFRALEEQK